MYIYIYNGFGSSDGKRPLWLCRPRSSCESGCGLVPIEYKSRLQNQLPYIDLVELLATLPSASPSRRMKEKVGCICMYVLVEWSLRW